VGFPRFSGENLLLLHHVTVTVVLNESSEGFFVLSVFDLGEFRSLFTVHVFYLQSPVAEVIEVRSFALHHSVPEILSPQAFFFTIPVRLFNHYRPVFVPFDEARSLHLFFRSPRSRCTQFFHPVGIQFLGYEGGLPFEFTSLSFFPFRRNSLLLGSTLFLNLQGYFLSLGRSCSSSSSSVSIYTRIRLRLPL